jgi:hypothetical protein
MANATLGGPMGTSGNTGLAKLFEDPEERMERIQSSIARSRLNKKRQRLNSGTSN